MKSRFAGLVGASALSLAATGILFVVGCDDFQELSAQASPGQAALANENVAAKPPVDAEEQGDAEVAGDGTEPKQSQEASPKGANVNEKVEKVVKTDEEWKKLLTPEEYYILRQKGTEPPNVNKYDHHFEPGTYVCAGCGAELFDSDTKFNSGCGWPAFYAAKAGDRVALHKDYSHFMVRTEVTCARCGGHLGHIFDDAPDQPTGQRYCINSVSMKFVPKKGAGAEAETPKPSATEPKPEAK
jgi:peptide-methionine (R)-S-oxide reductase